MFQAWAMNMDREFLFQCPLCGDAPPVLIGDATSESIQGRYYCGQSFTAPLVNAVAEPRPHTRAERSLFKAASDRKMLQAFATYVRGDGRSAFGHQAFGQ